MSSVGVAHQGLLELHTFVLAPPPPSGGPVVDGAHPKGGVVRSREGGRVCVCYGSTGRGTRTWHASGNRHGGATRGR
eukprot:7282388-Prymnesium_polylepis.1